MLTSQAFAIPSVVSHLLSQNRSFLFKGCGLNGGMNSNPWRAGKYQTVLCVIKEQNSTAKIEKRREVVDHICLLKAKKDLSDEHEKDMLDYLYTSQYQMSGIVSISLGSIRNQNEENYTHALFMRFQRKEDLTKFYKNPFYLKVLEEHVMPHCHGLINVDYESEVEDDILPIFRKGEEFNCGEEFVLLISFLEDASDEHIQEAMASFEELTSSFESLVVQSTQGSNFNRSSEEYTHVAVVRFRSLDAFEMFFRSSEYKDMWRSKFQVITGKTLAVHFCVEPVGIDLM